MAASSQEHDDRIPESAAVVTPSDWTLGPSTGPTGDPFRDCVRCGLCLESCPTYRLHGDEAQSPRGRILILDAIRDGTMDPTQEILDPLVSCLLCRSCETSCPSGVLYGHLMEKGRAVLHNRSAWRQRSLGCRLLARAVLSSVSHPGRQRFFAQLMRLFQSTGLQDHLAQSRVLADAAPWLAGAMSLIPRMNAPFEPPVQTSPQGVFSVQMSSSIQMSSSHQGSPSVQGSSSVRGSPARAEGQPGLAGGRSDGSEGAESKNEVVHVFKGCVTPWFFPDVSRAVDRVLRRTGHRVVYPSKQTCCGALHLHDGDEETARQLARRNILAFEVDPHAPIVVEAAGCGAVLKSYGTLLQDSPLYRDRAAEFSARVKDFSEWLAERQLPLGRAKGVKVAFQDPCHLYHVQGIRSAPRELLQGIAGVDIVDVEERDICCGSAGISNLLHPENGEALGREKAQVLARANPDLVVTSNPGCLLQLTKHMKPHGIPVRHLAQVLDAYLPAR